VAGVLAGCRQLPPLILPMRWRWAIADLWAVPGVSKTEESPLQESDVAEKQIEERLRLGL
jgi:hypothetical protein